MKGSQAVLDVIRLPSGEIELKLWHAYNIILTESEAQHLIQRIIAAMYVNPIKDGNADSN